MLKQTITARVCWGECKNFIVNLKKKAIEYHINIIDIDKSSDYVQLCTFYEIEMTTENNKENFECFNKWLTGFVVECN